MISNKKDFLKFIKGAGVGLYGTSASQQVSFKYSATIAKAIESKADNGALIFAVDATSGAGAIWAGSELVSSKVIDYAIADSASKDHGQKTVTLKYIGTAGVETKTFDLIDEAGLKAYFAGSKTIALDDSSIYEVKVKADGGIKVDNTNGLYVDIDELFDVDGKTIDFDAQNKLKTIVKLAYNATGIGGKPAIQLQTADSSALSEVEVEDLIGSGIVKSTSYNPANNTLTITWKGDPEVTTEIDLSAMLDVLNDVAVATGSTDYLTITADASTAKFGVTDKTKAAVALAETAIQNVTEGASVENYVGLTIAVDSSIATITTNDSSLNTKIVAIDQKDADQDASIDALQAYDIVIDASIDRLDASVSAIEAAIEAMDATPSDNALDGSIAISLTQANGVITGVDINATKATVTFDNTGNTPSLTSGNGLLVGDAITPIKNYVDAVAEKGFDGLDSEVEKKDASNFIGYKVGIVDGKLLDASCSLTAVFGNYADTNQTDGIATTGATKAYVDSEIQALDLANDVADSSAHDSKNYVKTVISETDGIVKNESVTVTYGNYSTHTAGIATVEDTSVFVQNALTWTVLS